MKRGNYGVFALVLLLFFFAIFVLFRPDITGNDVSDVTGDFAYDTSRVSNFTTQSVAVSGELGFNVNEDDISGPGVNLTNNSFLRVALLDNNGGLLSDKSMLLEEAKTKTTPALTFDSNGVVASTGDYTINVEDFNVATYQAGTFDLVFDIWFDNQNRVSAARQEMKVLVNASSAVVQPQNNTNTNTSASQVIRAPVLVQEIEDLILESGTVGELDLSPYFIDPYDGEMTYTVEGIFHGFVDVQGPIAIFNGTEGFEGTDRLRVRVYNTRAANYSNYFNITQVMVLNDSGVADENCVPQWTCNLWSDCIGGEMTRTCQDRNACGDDSGRPAESQKCSVTETSLQGSQGSSSSNAETTQQKTPLQELPQQKSNNTLLFILLSVFVVLILAAGGGAFYYFKVLKKEDLDEGGEESEEKKEGVAGDKENTSTASETTQSKDTGTNTSQTEQPQTKTLNVDQIYKYLEGKVNSGGDINQAKQELLKVGWKKEDVDRAVNVVTLRKYVNDKIKLGFDKEKLKETLRAKGWQSDILQDVFGTN